MDSGISARLDRRLAARLVEKKAPLDLLRPLPPAVVQRLADDMRVLLTYHSNAIEGNTLSLYETKMVIEEGVTISGQPLRAALFEECEECIQETLFQPAGQDAFTKVAEQAEIEAGIG